MNGRGALLIMTVCAVATGGCRLDMHEAPYHRAFDASTFFADGMSARPLVAGTVPQSARGEDDLLYTGKVDGRQAAEFPFPVTRETLRRGQERFNIYCSPCHSRTGDGDGMIVQRGYRRPPSYHIDRLRQAPPGHFFDVISNGFGAMPEYGSRVAPADRWAIIAYIRALQLSQAAPVSALPEEDRRKISQATGQAAPSASEAGP